VGDLETRFAVEHAERKYGKRKRTNLWVRKKWLKAESGGYQNAYCLYTEVLVSCRRKQIRNPERLVKGDQQTRLAKTATTGENWGATPFWIKGTKRRRTGKKEEGLH